MQVITAPEKIPQYLGQSIFLAGTIDNGNSLDFQKQVIEWFQNLEPNQLTIFNPRRKDWDSTMKPIASNPAFVEQVEWEWDALCGSDIILFNFLPNSLSPISLMELGSFVGESLIQNIFVVCPEVYFRSGNVKLLCKRFGVPVYENLIDALNDIKKIIEPI